MADYSTPTTGLARSVDVQTFTSSGTWTKPDGAKIVEYIVVGGGSGGRGINTSGPVTVAGSAGSASSIGSIVSSLASPHDPAEGGLNIGGIKTEASATVYAPGGASGSGYNAGGGGGAGYGSGGAGGAHGGHSGISAGANTGAGGGGAGYSTALDAGTYTGATGGDGGRIASGWMPASKFGSSETITVGTGGAGGSSTYSGGNGGSGIVIITTYF